MMESAARGDCKLRLMNYLILGASRGLGDAYARQLPRAGDTAWLVARGRPHLGTTDGVSRHWFEIDLSTADCGERVKQALGDARLDVVVYNAGIWEDSAFSAAYEFEAVGDEENARVIAVNLTGAINTLKRLLPNLRQSDNPKVILIGSVNGLENTRMPEVAYSASKFGLRGVAHALREHWRQHRIGVTVLNPGSIGPGDVSHGDLVALARCVIALSNGSCVKEIDIPAMSDPF